MRLRGFELSAAQFLRLALASVAALWLIVVTGAAVRLTDSGLGCRHWPGCEKGHPLPAKDYHAYIEFGNRVIGGVTIVVVLLAALAARRTPELSRGSRRLALAVFAGTLAQAPLGYLAARRERAQRLFAFGAAVVALLVVQMILGEIQYRTHLPWPLVLAHVGLAGAVWALLVAFVTVLWRPPRID